MFVNVHWKCNFLNYFWYLVPGFNEQNDQISFYDIITDFSASIRNKKKLAKPYVIFYHPFDYVIKNVSSY